MRREEESKDKDRRLSLRHGPFHDNQGTALEGEVKCAQPRYERLSHKEFVSTGWSAVAWHNDGGRCP